MNSVTWVFYLTNLDHSEIEATPQKANQFTELISQMLCMVYIKDPPFWNIKAVN